MPIPDYQVLMLPLLEVLADGQERAMRDVEESVARRFELTQEERSQLLPSGKTRVFTNRIGWAKTYLKNSGLIDNPSRGRVRISDVGQAVLSKKPKAIDLQFLRQFEGYRRFRGEEGGDEDPVKPVAPKGGENQATPLELFESSFQTMQTALAEELLGRLQTCSPEFFEHIVVNLLQAMGYGEGRVTNYSHDGGIDGVINEDKLGLDVVCIQAKRWQGTVSRPTVQAFVGSMDMIRAKKGVVITTANFSRDAMEFVNRIEGKRVVLIPGQHLAQLMIDHDVGVATTGTYKLKEVSNDFFEEEEVV
ncbi:MAG TPA: restriction endonuclease [Planctomycetaceae bacterium]|nr:restriction endonuclease [Planctomycetaceae bacterium]